MLVGEGTVEDFLLRRELKKLARTPSLAPGTPGFVASIWEQTSALLEHINIVVNKGKDSPKKNLKQMIKLKPFTRDGVKIWN